MVPDICGSSVWSVSHVTHVAPKLLKWLLDFWNNCAPLDEWWTGKWRNEDTTPWLDGWMDENKSRKTWSDKADTNRRDALIPVAWLPGWLNFMRWRQILLAKLLQFFFVPTSAIACQLTWSGYKAPDDREARRWLQNYGSAARNLLHVTCLTPGIWKWFLNFGKYVRPFLFVHIFMV